MPVPSIIHVSLGLRKMLTLLVFVFVTKCALAKGPDPATRILLEPLGFQALSQQFLLAGSSMVTIDFVDDRHVLLSYSAKRLLKRLAECPPSDQDHTIDAVLLELPSGKVLARTSWRMHDRGQYLWNLGQGRFMLRSRDTLTTFAPMVNLAKGDAFRERPFISTERRIGGILLSPDADLMILETLEPQEPSRDAMQPASAEEQRVRLETPVQINFFRVTLLAGEQIGLRPGGALRTRVPGRIPANSAGYVATLDQGQRHWAFDFHSYGGKVKELSPFDSTCRPTPILVSRSEFIAFGCGLSHSQQVVGAFNMRGEEMWQQNLPETYIAPTFVYAPKGGRFAMSRVLTHSSVVQMADLLVPEMVAGQAIVVYQTDSGRQILRIDATPVVRAGQNFALSPDGMSLAVVRGDAVEIYSLPPLTAKEREAIKLAEALAPQEDGAPVSLDDANSQSTPASESMVQNSTAASAPQAKPDDASTAPATPSPAPPADSSATQEGAAPTAQAPSAPTEENPASVSPRKPPTLYNDPGGQDAGGGSEAQKPGTPKQ